MVLQLEQLDLPSSQGGGAPINRSLSDSADASPTSFGIEETTGAVAEDCAEEARIACAIERDEIWLRYHNSPVYFVLTYTEYEYCRNT